MNLYMDIGLASTYKSNSQKIRMLSESWVYQNGFCPYCGMEYLEHFRNNAPVADFYCPQCAEEYELKSKNGSLNSKISDGAYVKMIERIQAVNNPNFFFLQYAKPSLLVENFFIVPKHFFLPELIEKRKPLAATAQRANWVGCNILLRDIPQNGRIYIVHNGVEQSKAEIMRRFAATLFIADYNLPARGWILDVLHCLNHIEAKNFTLKDIYAYESFLATKHPQNHYIQAKIRQQLQLLRDKGLLESCGNGSYKKNF